MRKASPKLSMSVRPADGNPNMEPDLGTMSHWLCRITYGRASMTVHFSMGQGHNGREPDKEEVMQSLFLDASGYDSAGSFEDWCGEYGYDTDSRKAERIYQAVEAQTRALRSLLGPHYNVVAQSFAER